MADLSKLYTKKQIEVLKRTHKSDWFMLINHGAKRSGKTIINNDLFLMELRRVRKIADKLGIEEPLYILAGVSSKTIQNNVLTELFNRYGLEFKFDKHGSFKLFGVKVVQAFTGTIGGLGGIRGMTSFGAYINEASLAKQEVFTEIVSRCSGEGARILVDTNPDNPNHWLKKEYIDNPDENIIDFSYKLEDNNFLSDRYIKNIKASTPSGKYYARDVDGLWTVAEGAVYSDFDKSIHVVGKIPNDIIRYYAGVDWGFDHYGVIVVIAEDSKGNSYIVDGTASKYKHIDWWINKAKEYTKKYGGIPFYCDTARTEHIYDFKRNYIDAIYANKSVLAGIEEVAKRWKNKSLFYLRGSIPLFEDEIYQYKWKENSKEDQVIKEFDDVMDALRYAIYTQYLIDKAKNEKPDLKDIARMKKLFK